MTKAERFQNALENARRVASEMKQKKVEEVNNNFVNENEVIDEDVTEEPMTVLKIKKSTKVNSKIENNFWYWCGRRSGELYEIIKNGVKWLKDNVVKIATAIVESIEKFMDQWEWTKNLYDWIASTCESAKEGICNFFNWLKNSIIQLILQMSAWSCWLAYKAGEAMCIGLAGFLGPEHPFSNFVLDMQNLVLKFKEMSEKELEETIDGVVANGLNKLVAA